MFKNNFVVWETRKIRKGNYFKVDGRYLTPFNNQNQRMVMRKNGPINVYWNLTSENKLFIGKLTVLISFENNIILSLDELNFLIMLNELNIILLNRINNSIILLRYLWIYLTQKNM